MPTVEEIKEDTDLVKGLTDDADVRVFSVTGLAIDDKNGAIEAVRNQAVDKGDASPNVPNAIAYRHRFAGFDGLTGARVVVLYRSNLPFGSAGRISGTPERQFKIPYKVPYYEVVIDDDNQTVVELQSFQTSRVATVRNVSIRSINDWNNARSDDVARIAGKLFQTRARDVPVLWGGGRIIERGGRTDLFVSLWTTSAMEPDLSSSGITTFPHEPLPMLGEYVVDRKFQVVRVVDPRDLYPHGTFEELGQIHETLLDHIEEIA